MTLFKGNISQKVVYIMYHIRFDLDTWQSDLVKCALFHNHKTSYTRINVTVTLKHLKPCFYIFFGFPKLVPWLKSICLAVR